MTLRFVYMTFSANSNIDVFEMARIELGDDHWNVGTRKWMFFYLVSVVKRWKKQGHSFDFWFFSEFPRDNIHSKKKEEKFRTLRHSISEVDIRVHLCNLWSFPAIITRFKLTPTQECVTKSIYSTSSLLGGWLEWLCIMVNSWMVCQLAMSFACLSVFYCLFGPSFFFVLIPYQIMLISPSRTVKIRCCCYRICLFSIRILTFWNRK